MSDFRKMIPFILHCEAGIPTSWADKPVDVQFERARKTGYANDPNDAGGPTLCGVTLATYAAYRRGKGYKNTTIADLKAMTYFEWEAILKTMYWDRWRADHITTQQVAAACVDWVWGSGKYGITKVQTLLGVKADGIVGEKTLGALNGYADQRELFNKIQAARNAYHAAIAKPGTKNAKFLKGWNRRVAMIQWDGFRLT